MKLKDFRLLQMRFGARPLKFFQNDDLFEIQEFYKSLINQIYF